MPAESDSTRIAAAVRAALPEGATLLGFSPEAVGVVVRRALTNAADWRDFDWEIVDSGSISPRMHLALDEVLTAEVGEGHRGPTLRIWEWNENAVVIGSFQSVKNEVDLENAAANGFDVVRRISGGGAMMMGSGNVITYSLYVPAELVQGMTFADSYAFLDEWVLQALQSLGIAATYQGLNDITSPAGKIGGAAQKRLGTQARFTDKSIQSYLMTGLIRQAIPGARIIVVRRDPRDVALSIYKNVFAEGTHRYAYDLKDLAHYCSVFLRVLDYWRDRLPGGFEEIRYEDLVADPEPQIRALVSAAGLYWEDSCLETGTTSGRVRTLSIYQVRQPIYASSRRAWERHAEEMAPFITAMGDRLS